VIQALFSKLNIEYYAVLDYGECRETNQQIISRRPFSPKSVIIYLIPYFVSIPKNLSIYAASRDYHIAISNIGNALIDCLKKHYPNNNFYSYGDHSPIDERHAALASGLGILGDNGLLINEKYGSYCFIGDVVTDIPIEQLPHTRVTEIKHCPGCGACKRACPTGILCGKGEDCLSAITQRKGELSEGEIALMRRYNTVWGCDECQRSCPLNSSVAVTPIDFFKNDRIECLTSDILAGMTKEQFRARAFGGRGRAVVERNLRHLGY
jgi:epoxyqueuosine reductase